MYSKQGEFTFQMTLEYTKFKYKDLRIDMILKLTLL